MQNLNRSKHQNLNNLFYDIGWRVSKYVDGLQQIVPAAKQLETVRRHRALTQLVQASPVPLESPNAVVLPHQAHKKARIVPEPYVCCALSHFNLPLSHSRSQQLSPAKRTPRTFQTIYTHCPLLLTPARWCAAKLFCAAYFLGAAPSKSPVTQYSSHRTCSQCQSGGRYVSLIREQTGRQLLTS